MTHRIEKFGDIGNFPAFSSIILTLAILNLWGHGAPTTKMIAHSDFNVLNVPIL